MNKSHILASLLIITVGALPACKKELVDEAVTTASFDVEEYSVDTTVDSLEKSLDDFSSDVDESQINIEPVNEDIADLRPDVPTIGPRPEECGKPAFLNQCRSNGVESAKMAKYDSCKLPNAPIVASGFVKLHFNNPVCGLRTQGNQVQRTYDLVFKSPRGFKGKVTSSENRNYLGKTLSGGGMLTNDGQSFSLDVLGRHQSLYGPRGHKLADVSIENIVPHTIVGTLSKQRRMIDGGTLAVYHNLAKFTALYSPENLAWTGDCKCPTSGKMNVEYRGKRNAKKSIEFLSCGKAEVTNSNGDKKEIVLRRCLEEEV